ncbi:MAG TPA: alpha/beta fold hydrolase [Mycobacteriales bacterium]|jgi:pimeloyl-ACP methyl ester carboxylesterase|nr:alpha/beta fold hydrolase [Mycobacteriales bacterium]
MNAGVERGYLPVNGLELYWERRGSSGIPLLVLGGGYNTSSLIAPLLDELAVSRQVVTLDLQGHGHTRDIDRPFSWDALADDVAGYLGDGQVDLLGCSLGGGVALRCAIRHPQAVRRLAMVSAPAYRRAWMRDTLDGFDAMNRTSSAFLLESPMFEAWQAVAPEPDPEGFLRLIDRTGELLRSDYDWRDEVRDLGMPVLLAFADRDAIPTSHLAEFFALLGGGTADPGWNSSEPPWRQLAVLPGRTHYDVFASAALPPIIDAFLRLTG